MSDRTPSAPERRTSYGPSSPTLGARGSATRQRILDAALECFVTQGYHATVIDDIASSIEVSRATLYQYFASKEDLFLELVEESGAELQQVVRAIDPLGPTASGYANLHAWLSNWADVFERFSAVFVEWANVNTPRTPLRPRMDAFVESHTRKLSAALADAGAEVAADVGAIVMIAVIERCHYLRTVHPTGLTADELTSELANAFQLTLFPTTPRGLLAPPGPGRPRTADDMQDRPPTSDRFDQLGSQATKTVDHLLEAAAAVFAERGYGGSSIDDIVAQARVSRGTVYKYFDNRLDLFAALASRGGRELGAICEELSEIDPNDPAALMLWFERYSPTQRRLVGLLRAWTESRIVDVRVTGPRDLVARQALTRFDRLRARVADPPVGRHAADIMFLSLLERAVDIAVGTRFEPTSRDLSRTQALLVERGLLGITNR